MITLAVRTGWLLIGTTVTVALTGVCALAQDGDGFDTNIGRIARPAAREEVVRRRRERMLLTHMHNVETWVASKYTNLAGIQEYLETRLAARLDELRVTCPLSEFQRNKLLLGGRGDVKHLLDRLDNDLRGSPDANISDWAMLAAESRDLQEQIDIPFGPGSLFGKVLVTTLSAEQLIQYETALRDKNAVRYREAVIQTVVKLGRLLGLSARQCDEFSTLLLTETAPPLKFGQSDYAFVMFQASRVSEAKLQSIFQEREWKAIKRQLASWADSGDTLRAEGFEFTNRQVRNRGAGAGLGVETLRRTN